MARIHDKIRHILETTPGLTQKGLAERMGLNPAAVNRMLYGRRNIMADEIPVIESYIGQHLDISGDYAQDRASPRGFSDVTQRNFAQDNHPHNHPVPPRISDMVPVFSCGGIGGAVVDWAARHPCQAGLDGAFAVYVETDDMSPRYFRGELVYLHPSRPLETGRDTLILTTDGDALLRRVISQNEGQIGLMSFHPVTTETLLPRQNIRACYAVVGRN